MNEEPTEAEYVQALRLIEKAADSAFSPTQEPFLVEPFCTQVAWMGKECPVYPFTKGHPKDICKFLTQEGHENYRCPAVSSESQIFKPIYARGTPEQKKALETLADMTIRYAQLPMDEEVKAHFELSHYQCLGEAIQIYRNLGLTEKAKTAQEVWKKITTRPAENE